MATYKAAYLYGTGGIECGDVIEAFDDASALREANKRAMYRHASLFGLHEKTGTASHGADLIRPVVRL